jgi:predicted nucleic acid-binding protein
MQALRAQALATSPLANHLYDEMRLAEALKAADATQHAWREFVRLDPGNVISWSNLGVSYFIRNFSLQGLGRPAEAAATLKASLEIERLGPASFMTYDRVGFLAGQLALLEANRGQIASMEEALAVNARMAKWVADHAPAGSFLRESRMVFPEAWRLYTLPLRGEYRQALERAAALLPKFEALKPQDVQQGETQANVLRAVNGVVAHSAYALEDYATAERAISRVLELHAKVPIERLSDRRELEAERTFKALVLARLGRTDEAQKLAAAALKFERDLATRNRDSAYQRLELAQALYVAAVAGLGDANAQLAEADAIMKKLPAEMQKLREVAIWQERISGARSAKESRPTAKVPSQQS